MSSIAATRTTRFAPPAPPTRKATPKSRLVGQGPSVVGRADRSMLRIVADDDCAPVFTRVAPAALPMVEPPSVVEGSSVVEVAEPRRVCLDDFFAAEYDGDDQRLEGAPVRASTVRLT